MKIGILADDGQPIREVHRALQKLLDDLDSHENGQDDTVYTGKTKNGDDVESRVETIPTTTEGEVELSTYAPKIMEANGWDRLIYVTDLPLTAWERPVISQTTRTRDAVLISMPALGLFGARRQLVKELDGLLVGEEASLGVSGESKFGPEDPEDTDAQDLKTRVFDNRLRSLRLLLGMIRGNQPMRLMGALSGSLAAIAASGGFGVFYGSIWMLSDAVSIPRLIGISLLAVAILSGWLIVRNQLWQRSGAQEAKWRERIDNLATTATIMTTVLVIFFVAAVAMTLLTLVVAPADYLANQIGRSPNLFTYVRIGVFSAALGTIAGAIGSNFDRSVEIRTATYNEREYERRRKAGYYSDSDEEDES